MSLEQYTTGTVLVTAASTLVYGTNTQWNSGNIREGNRFKLSLDDAYSYTVATIMSATKLQLSSEFHESGGQGKNYIITRSFTPYRSYARLYQGDSSGGDILREQIVNEIDKDVGRIYNGTATLSGCRVVATGGSHYWDINVNATGQLCFAYNGTKKAHVATSTGTWIQV